VIFTELRFPVFFGLVFAAYWLLRGNRGRKAFLLLASWVFYAAWDWRFLGLILYSSGIDYVCGRWLQREERPARRRWIMALTLVTNLGLLGFFKYYDFFVESAGQLLRWFGFQAHPTTLAVILPVGISFYTFQTLSYTIDVYRRKIRAVDSALDFFLFVGFFPQLVAGPIVRATEFLPQLEDKKRLGDVAFRSCLTLFLIGFVKKAVISDNIAPITTDVFAEPATFSAASNWITFCLWHVQIYCDFSGYSDMAIATAGLLGYRLPLNFDFPYFAHNIGEFWQRWHITLSSWFRDYLYVSLGGSRGSLVRGLVTGSVTMLLCGLWHGAGWQYVGFGVLMSGAIVLTRLWSEVVPAESALRRSVHAAGPLIMTWFLFLNWIVFRAVSWDKCAEMLRIFFFLDAGGPRTVSPAWLGPFAALGLLHWALWRGLPQRLLAQRSDYAFAAAYGASAAVVLALMAINEQPFIYFQF